MTLSVIIPVYKVENTLQRCVESVLNQSFCNLEVILVNDGSPDNCGSICDDWAKKDHRIKVIHQHNGGLSAARNAGLNMATGNYITFVDSDDYIEQHTYQQLTDILTVHTEYDLLEYPVVVHHHHPTQEHRLSFKPTVYTDINQYWFDAKAYQHAYSCNKIYRKEVFTTLRFPLKTAFEDISLLPAILSQCRVVATTNVGLYYYCINPKGITATAKGKELEDLLNAHLQVLRQKDIWQNNGFATYYAHVLNIQLDVFESTGKAPVLPKFRFSYNENIPFKLKIANIIGIKAICRLNKLIHKVYKSNRL